MRSLLIVWKSASGNIAANKNKRFFWEIGRGKGWRIIPQKIKKAPALGGRLED
jgi:hypothetical protein